MLGRMYLSHSIWPKYTVAPESSTAVRNETSTGRRVDQRQQNKVHIVDDHVAHTFGARGASPHVLRIEVAPGLCSNATLQLLDLRATNLDAGDYRRLAEELRGPQTAARCSSMQCEPLASKHCPTLKCGSRSSQV